MQTAWRALLPVGTILGLCGCVDFADYGNADRYKEDFHFSYPLNEGGTISLENTNGSVEITGSSQNTVEIDGTKYAATKALLDAVKIDTSATPGSVRIRTVRPMDTHGGAGARYTIRVPGKVVLDSIVTTNGGIRIEGVDGTARLRSTNGSIRISKLHGDLEARTTNGGVEADGVEGNAKLHTSNGSIKADASHGTLEAETTNGSITAALADPSSNWPVKLHSTNGRIDLRVKAEKVPDIRAGTTNSSITLRLPANANARLHATTSHATITSDFDVASQSGTRSKTDLEGNIGSGGSLLDLSSTNGSIKVVKL